MLIMIGAAGRMPSAVAGIHYGLMGLWCGTVPAPSGMPPAVAKAVQQNHRAQAALSLFRSRISFFCRPNFGVGEPTS